jgi:peptide chain release factor 2
LSPDFWNNPQEAQAHMKFIQSKKQWVDDYNAAETLIAELEVLIEFLQEGEVSEEEVEKQYEKALNTLEKMEFKNM